MVDAIESEDFRTRQLDLISKQIEAYRLGTIKMGPLASRLEGLLLALYEQKIPENIWSKVCNIEEVNAVLLDNGKKPSDSDLKIIAESLSSLESLLGISA